MFSILAAGVVEPHPARAAAASLPAVVDGGVLVPEVEQAGGAAVHQPACGGMWRVKQAVRDGSAIGRGAGQCGRGSESGSGARQCETGSTRSVRFNTRDGPSDESVALMMAQRWAGLGSGQTVVQSSQLQKKAWVKVVGS